MDNKLRYLRLIRAGIVILAMTFVFGSCAWIFGSDDEGTSGITRARVSHGVAVALSGDNINMSSLMASGFSASSAAGEDIYTIDESGDVTIGIDFGGGDWRPKIAFTAVDVENSMLYVGMEWWWSDDSRIGLFAIDTNTDQVFTARLPGRARGAVKSWYWNQSAMRDKPILFSETGRAYFAVFIAGNNYQDRIASWDPRLVHHKA